MSTMPHSLRAPVFSMLCKPNLMYGAVVDFLLLPLVPLLAAAATIAPIRCGHHYDAQVRAHTDQALQRGRQRVALTVADPWSDDEADRPTRRILPVVVDPDVLTTAGHHHRAPAPEREGRTYTGSGRCS